MAADLDTFWALIDDMAVCMMTTRDGAALHSRPMVADIDKSTHEFRFLTKLSSHKIDALAANPAVNLAFCDAQRCIFVSVSGQAYLTQDRTLIDAIWRSGAARYFDGARDDPDTAVIRVVPATAEHWNSDRSLQQSWTVFKPRNAELKPAMDPEVAFS